MQWCARQFRHLLKSEDGPTAVEYAVVLAMGVLVGIGAINSVGNAVKGSLENTANLVGNAAGGDSGSGGSGGGGSDSGGGGSSDSGGGGSNNAGGGGSSNAGGGGSSNAGGGKGRGKGS